MNTLKTKLRRTLRNPFQRKLSPLEWIPIKFRQLRLCSMILKTLLARISASSLITKTFHLPNLVTLKVWIIILTRFTLAISKVTSGSNSSLIRTCFLDFITRSKVPSWYTISKYWITLSQEFCFKTFSIFLRDREVWWHQKVICTSLVAGCPWFNTSLRTRSCLMSTGPF